MTIEQYVKSLDNHITRVRLTSAGLIIEANIEGTPSGFSNTLFQRVFDSVLDNYKEIVYSFYFYSNAAERFVIDGILREKESEKLFNMSTSTLGTNDIFGKFTKYDFDVLTLSNRDENVYVDFVIDQHSPTSEPRIIYKELDMMGHQFNISAKAQSKGSHFQISVAPGLDFY